MCKMPVATCSISTLEYPKWVLNRLKTTGLKHILLRRR